MKEFNIIFLTRRNFLLSDMENPTMNVAMIEEYDNLLISLLKHENSKYNILLLEYELSEKNRERSFLLKAVTNNKIDVIHDFGNITYTDGDTLGLALQIVKLKFEAKKVILFTWEHASGYTLFSGSNLPEINNVKKPAVMNLVKKSHIESFAEDKQSFSATLDKTEMLTVEELTRAIKLAYDDKIELIAMMNCVMLRLENAFELSICTNSFIGASTPMWWIGYDYECFFETLNSNINSPIVAYHSLVNSYYEKQEKDIQKEFYRFQIITGIFGLSEFTTEFTRRLNELTILLLEEDEVLLKLKKELVENKWLDLSNYMHLYYIENNLYTEEIPIGKFEYGFYFYDIFLIIKYCLENTQKDQTKDKCSQLIALLNKYCLKSEHVKGTKYTKVSEAFGISIHTPPSLKFMMNDDYYEIFNSFYSNLQMKIYDKSIWLDFVVKVINFQNY